LITQQEKTGDEFPFTGCRPLFGEVQKMNDLIDKYLSNPLILGAVAFVVVLVMLILVMLFLRSRKSRSDENNVQSKLLALEREAQFAAAVEQVAYQALPEQLASQIAGVFKDYLSLPVFKIYAGHHSDKEFSNVLPKDKNSALVTNDLAITEALPQRIPATAALGFSHPQTINTNALMTQQPMSAGQSITVLPWRAAFGWSGLIVANAMHTNPSEALSSFREPIALLSNKLAVALEMASEQVDRFDVEQRVSRSDDYYQSIIQSLEDEAPLNSILRETAALLGGDSAALWLHDKASQMLRLNASFGLRTTEFLPLPMGQGLAGNVVETGQPLALEEASSDPRCLFPRETRESGIGSYLGVPVVSDGVVMGALEVHTVNSKWWSDNEAATLISAASAIAAVIKSTSVRGNKLRVENAYLGLAEALQRLRTTDDLKEAVVEVLGHALGVSRAVILDFDNATGPLTIQHEFISQNTKSAIGATFKATTLRDTIEAASGGEPLAISDSALHSLIGGEQAKQLDILSELAIPVRYDGKTRSMIYLHQCDRVRTWHQDEMEFADRVGRQLSLSLTNVEALNTASQSADAAREAARSASESMNRAQTVIHSMPESVMGLDKDGRLTFFNNTARNWLGLKQEDLGKVANWIAPLAMTDEMLWSRVTACRSVSRFASRLKHNDYGERTLSESLIMDDDDSRAVSVSVAPVKSTAGELNGFIVVLSDTGHIARGENGASSHLASLMEQQADIENRLAEARAAELHARARIEKLNSLEVSLRESGGTKQLENALQQERERFKYEQSKLQNQIQQMHDTNQLKNEFIVNCGNDMESSIQATIGAGEMLEQGFYGPLNEQQQSAIREIIKKARNIKSDVSNLVEYGASRAR
jgi:GAF domain-containing protein